MAEWESTYLEQFNGQPFRNVGYISYAAVRTADTKVLEVSWYPNIMDRFHEVSGLLPRSAFVACVDVYDRDEKPHIFVKSDWLTGLHLRPYSAFGLIDAIGVKNALRQGLISAEKLIEVRNRIDQISDINPGVAFVSFADSLLLKSNWFVGQYDSDINYSYEPETLVRLLPLISQAYHDVLGMKVYATITQGVNEYGDNSLIHQSSTGGHVSLNSLGLPFSQVLAIDEAARNAIHTNEHPPHELYIDQMFFHSLRFKNDFSKHDHPSASYAAPMSSTPGKYYCMNAHTLIANLDTSSKSVIRKRK